MTLALYGHPFSSYTWKALIALYANATRFEFRSLDPGHPDHAGHATFVATVSPLGKFPVLREDARTIFEASAIVEFLHLHHPGPALLLPADPDAALEVRTLDRVFDLSVMDPVQQIVDERIRSSGQPDPELVARESDRLARSYRWLDAWLTRTPRIGQAITLIECAAAPALFYADWVCPIPKKHAALRRWRAHLLALAPVARCIREARPYRDLFPGGAPDRD